MERSYAIPTGRLAALHVEPTVGDLRSRHPAVVRVGLRDAPEAGGAGLPHHRPQLAVQDVERRLGAGLPERGEAGDVGAPYAHGRRRD